MNASCKLASSVAVIWPLDTKHNLTNGIDNDKSQNDDAKDNRGAAEKTKEAFGHRLNPQIPDF